MDYLVEFGKPASAPHNLRNPLMAHAHDLGDGLHRQAVFVGGADGLVPFLAELVGCLF